jgi:hypothetical protein
LVFGIFELLHDNQPPENKRELSVPEKQANPTPQTCIRVRNSGIGSNGMQDQLALQDSRLCQLED